MLYVAMYLDDIILTGATKAQHLETLGVILGRLEQAERNYPQFDKEGTAVMFALKKFHKQLYGRCFVIMSDHKPLVSLFGELKQVPITA